MNNLEEKNLKTQLDLLNGVVEIDRMILHTIQSTAQGTLKKIIEPKMYGQKDKETVEFTLEEFKELRLTLARIATNEGNKQLNDWISGSYIEPKSEKLRILNLLK